jgi:hypothetical protein
MRITNLVCALVATALPTIAAAEEYDPYASPPVSSDRGFVAVAFEQRFHAVDIATQLITLEGGYRLAKSPLVARAAVGFGGYGDNDTARTSGIELRGGIEADTCTRGRGACAFAGLDGGYFRGHHTSLDAMTYDDSGPVLVGRAGFDVGGEVFRLRAGLEVTEDSIGVALALGHRFY